MPPLPPGGLGGDDDEEVTTDGGVSRSNVVGVANSADDDKDDLPMHGHYLNYSWTVKSIAFFPVHVIVGYLSLLSV